MFKIFLINLVEIHGDCRLLDILEPNIKIIFILIRICNFFFLLLVILEMDFWFIYKLNNCVHDYFEKWKSVLFT